MINGQTVREGLKKSWNVDKYDYQTTAQHTIKGHKLAVNVGVKYDCDPCQYHVTAQCDLK